MPKTVFVRKAVDIDEVREESTQYLLSNDGQAPDEYYVAQEIQLEENAFFDLLSNLYEDRDWIRAFSNHDYPMKGEAVAAMRVTCKGSLTVLIIDPQGFGYARYVGLGE